MTTLDRPARPKTSTTASAPAINWALRLTTRMAARSLNMPEPLLHDASAFVFAHVTAAEQRAVKTLCPFTLLRQFLARRRKF